MAAERDDEREVLLEERLRSAPLQLNQWTTEEQPEQPGFCIEGVGAPGDFMHEGDKLLVWKRSVVVARIDDAHRLDLHRRAVGAHTKNAHRLRPEGAFDDGVCRHSLKHGILCSVQFSVLEIRTTMPYTKVPPSLIGTPEGWQFS